MHAETNGTFNCSHAGQSGEMRGCVQYLPDTYRRYAMKTLGYVPPATDINQEYIAVLYYTQLLEQGFTVAEIALLHNQGDIGKCRIGVNSKNVPYNSCAYRDRVVLAFAQYARD